MHGASIRAKSKPLRSTSTMARCTLHRSRGRALLVSLTFLFAGDIAVAESKPGPLLGGFPAQISEPKVRLDPSLPTGASFEVGARPTPDTPRLCSWRYPICVHATSAIGSVTPSEALAALESSYRALVGALRLPAPLLDLGAGGGSELDVYLIDSGNPLEALPDLPWAQTDRAAAFCLLPAVPVELGNLSLRCLAEAISFGLDASETPANRAAYAAHLAAIVGQGTNGDLAALDDLQAHPEVSLLARERSERSGAARLLFEMLEAEWGNPVPGSVTTALFSLSRGDGPSLGLEWNNEPDLADVLRHTVGKKPGDVADWFGNFAIARAKLGRSVDQTPLFGLAASGDFAKARYDWRIKFSSLPRRVASKYPLEPLGTTYLWLDLDEVPLGATLGFRAEWEGPVAFKWLLVALDAQGHEIQRLDVPYLERGTSIERSWVNFEAASAIVIAGVNLGDVDLAHPFDPDYEPWEPHGCTVYLASIQK
jgi:hypothetical protein